MGADFGVHDMDAQATFDPINLFEARADEVGDPVMRPDRQLIDVQRLDPARRRRVERADRLQLVFDAEVSRRDNDHGVKSH